MKYYAIGYEDCSEFIREYDTKEELEAFLESFVEQYGSLDDKADNLVQRVIYGKILSIKTKCSLGDV